MVLTLHQFAKTIDKTIPKITGAQFIVSNVTGTYWGKQTNKALIIIQHIARILITRPAAPRLKYLSDGRFRKLARRRQVGMA